MEPIKFFSLNAVILEKKNKGGGYVCIALLLMPKVVVLKFKFKLRISYPDY